MSIGLGNEETPASRPAAKRIALLICNGTFLNESMNPLPGQAKDAETLMEFSQTPRHASSKCARYLMAASAK